MIDNNEIKEEDLENVSGGDGAIFYICSQFGSVHYSSKKINESGNCPICNAQLKETKIY